MYIKLNNLTDVYRKKIFLNINLIQFFFIFSILIFERFYVIYRSE